MQRIDVPACPEAVTGASTTEPAGDISAESNKPDAIAHGAGNTAPSTGNAPHRKRDSSHSTADTVRRKRDTAHSTGDAEHRTGDTAHRTGDAAHRIGDAEEARQAVTKRKIPWGLLRTLGGVGVLAMLIW